MFVTRRIFEMVPGIWYQQFHYQHLNEDFVAVETSGSTIPWHEFRFGDSQTVEKIRKLNVYFLRNVIWASRKRSLWLSLTNRIVTKCDTLLMSEDEIWVSASLAKWGCVYCARPVIQSLTSVCFTKPEVCSNIQNINWYLWPFLGLPVFCRLCKHLCMPLYGFCLHQF